MKALRLIVVAQLTCSMATAHAAEIGHFAPGVLNIRDFAMPEQGFYGVLYNYYYTTDRLNDVDGNEIDSITINPGPGPGVTLDLDIDVDAYAMAPTLIWVSPYEVLGAKYGAYVSLTLSNTSVGASLSTAAGSGRSADESQFGLGDLFVQPLWVGWTALGSRAGLWLLCPDRKVRHPDRHAADCRAADRRSGGQHRVWVSGRISSRALSTWYPWADKRMAVATALTYEIHGEKDDFDLTPGDNLTLNWGLSQYLPFPGNENLLIEVGPAGYSSWQVSNDSGVDATDPRVKDEVHAAGLQIGVTHVPWNATFNFRYLYEFDSKDRFQGESFGLNFAVKF